MQQFNTFSFASSLPLPPLVNIIQLVSRGEGPSLPAPPIRKLFGFGGEDEEEILTVESTAAEAAAVT